MIYDITIPPAGESITSAAIARWYKKNGDWVTEGDLLVSLETDKVSNDLQANHSGSLKILVSEGEEVSIGTVIGQLDDEALRTDVKKSHEKVLQEAAAASVAATSPEPAPPVGESESAPASVTPPSLPPQGEPAPALFSRQPPGAPPPNAIAALVAAAEAVNAPAPLPAGTEPAVMPPVTASAGEAPAAASPPPGEAYGLSADGRTERIRMTPLRRKVASQLVSVQSESAILTTFNECDMSAVMELRKTLQEDFVKRHGIKLGFMSFFIKSVVNALKAVPEINAQIDGNDIVKKHFYDISVAVGTDKGLVVPVIRNCDKKSFAEIERSLAELAEKARQGQISLADLQGGVFTISNGGVYGSLLSTPIINPPQSGILGLHAIQERPVAEKGQVVIRPMMYLALSYDHRLVDGKQAVTFLLRIKECIENPTRLLLEA